MCALEQAWILPFVTPIQCQSKPGVALLGRYGEPPKAEPRAIGARLLMEERAQTSRNCFLDDIDQTKIEAQAKGLVAPGPSGKPSLAKLGYLNVGIDDGWQACGQGVNGTFHDKDGRPLINMTRFPDLKGMVDTVHKLGCTMGWYMNNCGCSERGHPPQTLGDAKAVSEFGFDAVKV